MAHGIEETGSESSYTPISSCNETEDEVRSAGVPDNAAAQATEAGLGDRETTQKEVEEEIDIKSETWKKDDTFFFSLVTFRVEDRLFRVPKDPFENQSEHFRKLFANVPTGTKPVRDIDEPIFLPGIDKDAFRDLLRLLYPPPMTSSFSGPVFLTREQWIKVLDPAQTWGFAGIRALAIQKLELAFLGEIEKLELALKYQIEQWYADVYLALAKRPQPLSIDEGRRLGLELSLKLAGVRERNLAYMKDKFSGAGTPENKLGLFAPFADSSKLFRITEDAISPPSPVPQKDDLKSTPESKPTAQTSSTPSHSDISPGTSSETVKPKHVVLPPVPGPAKPRVIIKLPAKGKEICDDNRLRVASRGRSLLQQLPPHLLVMTHEIEEFGSESSYTRVSPVTDNADEVSSAVVSDNEDSQVAQPGLSDRETTQKEIEEEIDAKSETWKKDDTFFFSLVTFRVEDRLFRVPKDPFENQSEHFRRLFANVPTSTETKPARDIDEPIFLPGVERDAFRDLLRLLYPAPMTSSFAGPIFLSREQWIKVLDLAQTWGFAGIRALAIQKLESADFGEIEKLELALKYQIKQWYAGAYLALAKRPESLSIDEGRRLGLELSLKMAGVRERRLTHIKKKVSNSDVPEDNSEGLTASGRSSNPFGTPRDAVSAFSAFSSDLPKDESKSTAQTPPSSDRFGDRRVVKISPRRKQQGAVSCFSTSFTPDVPALPFKGNRSTGKLDTDYDNARLRQDIKETFDL
ncbi:hypothetical protein A7U60_g5809 [Sanghuangporus baumii]|uniref:BTB domain-containing protein n=1 Tax=Sanghuangporus baumii TaxID=108892 RepID=A0A9Q5HWB8_SANBA|nr:hypothetical protein A7U60_g5809 [Sanghuangporus baumii]